MNQVFWFRRQSELEWRVLGWWARDVQLQLDVIVDNVFDDHPRPLTADVPRAESTFTARAEPPSIEVDP